MLDIDYILLGTGVVEEVEVEEEVEEEVVVEEEVEEEVVVEEGEEAVVVVVVEAEEEVVVVVGEHVVWEVVCVVSQGLGEWFAGNTVAGKMGGIEKNKRVDKYP